MSTFFRNPTRLLASRGHEMLGTSRDKEIAHEWGDDLRHAMMELEQHPQSVRNNLEVGSFYVAGKDKKSRMGTIHEHGDRAL